MMSVPAARISLASFKAFSWLSCQPATSNRLCNLPQCEFTAGMTPYHLGAVPVCRVSKSSTRVLTDNKRIGWKSLKISTDHGVAWSAHDLQFIVLHWDMSVDQNRLPPHHLWLLVPRYSPWDPFQQLFRLIKSWPQRKANNHQASTNNWAEQKEISHNNYPLVNIAMENHHF